ncbi:hypothetical protein VC83_07591 [Pseudogymnoascus destructans]|uniref:Uncharacterized protein n=1 Tax=Pseudogymnoascus destructans TaxID=655981 RepID=A0A177A369_9PEZI|nr:uncharacterized protein VC83_07591 [Pseudogymnoascus destructans]OAF55533.1 hypothetical protein VC83_07591 [Pseudogymnoascus destructans]
MYVCGSRPRVLGPLRSKAPHTSRDRRLREPSASHAPRSPEQGDSGDWLDLAISGPQRRETREIGLIWRSQFSREPSCSHAPRSPEAGDSEDWLDLAIPGLQRRESREIGRIWRSSQVSRNSGL